MAKLLTGISGNLISAASAGYAPTNSSDVSAIASAYQVVSATATQLYAGTAYVTSVNNAPLSASRAGNAANASLANSAWYDGTGRLISALPDSAAVSAIASAYAESAASSKQDTLTFGYDDDKISTINGSALAGGGGGGVDSATVSAIASSYAESAASSKVDLYNVDTVKITAKGLAFSGASGITARSSNNMAVLQTSPIPRMSLSNIANSKRVDIYLSGISGNEGGTWQYGTAEYDKLTSVYGVVSSNSASWCDEGVDSATVSAIASSYAESAVSGKADSSAMSSYVPYSGLEYNTASAISGINGSALAAGSTYSAGEGIDITDDVISVEAPVDIVAGPGIVIDNPDGNTLRVSQSYPTDRTVLYNNGSVSVKTATLSETIENFEWLMVRMDDDHHGGRWVIVDTSNPWAKWLSNYGYDAWNTSSTNFGFRELGFTASGTTITSITGCQKQVGWNSTSWAGDHQTGQFGGIVKVIGIHRIANN